MEYPINTIIHFRNTGNIVAEPEIIVKITKNNVPVEDVTDNSDSLQPGEFKVINVLWDTNGMATGEYLANITIFLGEKNIFSKNITFELFSPGTLTRSGMISSIVANGNMIVGGYVNIIAEFVNDGEIDVDAQFIGNVFKNNILVDTIESLEETVEKNEIRTFPVTYNIPSNGSYEIKGFFRYSGVYYDLETNITKIKFIVGSTESSLSFGVFEMGIIGICGSIIVAAYGLKRRKVSKNKHNNAKNNNSIKSHKDISIDKKPDKISDNQIKQSQNIGEIENFIDNLDVKKR